MCPSDIVVNNGELWGHMVTPCWPVGSWYCTMSWWHPMRTLDRLLGAVLIWRCCLTRIGFFMMMSSSGNTFCSTGHLCGEFTDDRWIPCTKASDAELWCFLWSARGWWFEMPSCPLWCHCNDIRWSHGHLIFMITISVPRKIIYLYVMTFPWWSSRTVNNNKKHTHTQMYC